MKSVIAAAVTAVVVTIVMSGCVPVVSPEDDKLLIDTTKTDTTKTDTTKTDTTKTDTTKPVYKTTIMSVESDYMSGAMTAVVNGTYQNVLTSISPDAVIVSQLNERYILERDLANIIKLTPEGSVAYQVKLLKGFNPHDLVILNSAKGYVCGNSSDSIVVINPANGAPSSVISLSAILKEGITTNPTKMILLGDMLYVACQMRNGWNPGEGSVVVQIDTKTDAIVGTARCSFKNVSDLDVYKGNLVVTSSGAWNVVDGGVELVSIPSMATSVLVAGTTLGNEITSLAIDEKRGEFYGTLYRAWGDAPIVHYSSAFAPIDTVAGVVQGNAPQYDPLSDKLIAAEIGTTAKSSVFVWDPLKKTKNEYFTTLPVQSFVFISSLETN